MHSENVSEIRSTENGPMCETLRRARRAMDGRTELAADNPATGVTVMGVAGPIEPAYGLGSTGNGPAVGVGGFWLAEVWAKVGAPFAAAAPAAGGAAKAPAATASIRTVS